MSSWHKTSLCVCSYAYILTNNLLGPSSVAHMYTFFSYIYTDHLLLDNQLGCSSLGKTWFSFNHHQLLVALYVGMGLSEISHIQVACQLVPLFRFYLGDHSVAMSWVQLIFLIQKYCNRYPGPLAFNNFSLPLPVCSLGCVVDVSIGSGHPRCFWPFVASIYNGLHPLQREALMRGESCI